MKPVVGLLPLYDSQLQSLWMLPGYMEAVLKAGGLPLMLPLQAGAEDVERLAALCDGFIFTGGQDVDPLLYGQQPTPLCAEISPARDALETALLGRVLQLDKPVLGICRGMQFLNVFLGGTLYQDLNAQLKTATPVNHHQPKPYTRPHHLVTLVPGTPLQKWLGKEMLQVNSCHHQGVLALGQGLVPTATAPDGLVEAVYLPGKRHVHAYQWHPEYLFGGDEAHLALFNQFVQACTTATQQ